MSQLHANILKLLQDKKSVKISTAKLRKLKDGLKRLHEEATGAAQESVGYFSVPLQNQQQETSTLTNGPVPHFLEAVTRYILDNATQEGIIRKNGNERRVSGLREIMEKNGAHIPASEYSVHDVTCVLKRWLRCLPEPVVPRVLHDVFAKCVELDSHHHSTQALLLACLLLPTFHLNTLKHVAVFLQEIAKNDLCNKMTSENLAKVLAPSLMPRVLKVETDPELAKKFSKSSTTAVQVLIDNAPLIGVLPPEYEALREGKSKDFSEDDLSDCEAPLAGERQNSKKKLFTFLKSKGSSSTHRASVLRTPQQPSKRLAPAKNIAQSCPPKITKASLRDQVVKLPAGVSSLRKKTPPPRKRNEIIQSTRMSSDAVAALEQLLESPPTGQRKSSKSSFHSPPLQNEGTSIGPSGAARTTRSASQALHQEAANRIRERRIGKNGTDKSDVASHIVDKGGDPDEQRLVVPEEQQQQQQQQQQLQAAPEDSAGNNPAVVQRQRITGASGRGSSRLAAGLSGAGSARLSRLSHASVRSLPARSSYEPLSAAAAVGTTSTTTTTTTSISTTATRQPRPRTSVRRSATLQAAMKFSYGLQTGRVIQIAKDSSAAALSCAASRRSPRLARGVPARKASIRSSTGAKCSPRKPPRTTRLTDAGIKVKLAQPSPRAAGQTSPVGVSLLDNNDQQDPAGTPLRREEGPPSLTRPRPDSVNSGRTPNKDTNSETDQPMDDVDSSQAKTNLVQVPVKSQRSDNENADEVAAIIGQLSVAHGNSPEDGSTAPRSMRRSLTRSSSGRRHTLDSYTPVVAVSATGDNKEFRRHSAHMADEDDFVLRTVNDDPMDHSRDSPDAVNQTIEEGAPSDERRDNGDGGSRSANDSQDDQQSASSSTSSLMTAMLSAARWSLAQRRSAVSPTTIAVAPTTVAAPAPAGAVDSDPTSMNSSGTCVDSEDDSKEAFVDGEEFLRRLTEEESRQQQQQQQQKPPSSSRDRRHATRPDERDKTRTTSMAEVTETPARRCAEPEAEDGESPNSRRESVIAIRVSRAGFVRRNVREIENTFATPIGTGVRTRRQNTPGPVPVGTRLRLAVMPGTPLSERRPEPLDRRPEPLDRHGPSRRPLTPGNARKLLEARRSSESKLITETLDV